MNESINITFGNPDWNPTPAKIGDKDFVFFTPAGVLESFRKPKIKKPKLKRKKSLYCK